MFTVFAIVLHVSLSFDSSIRSRIVKAGAAAEAEAIWRDYDVDLSWADRPDVHMCLAAYVGRSAAPPLPSMRAVLGTTLVGPDPTVAPAPIRIGFDTVDALASPAASVNAMMHEYAVGNAIGRVLAHEIGHILLGAPSYHDPTGLMRSNFLTDDFSRSDRWRFKLAGNSAARLRERIVALSQLAIAPGCPAH